MGLVLAHAVQVDTALDLEMPLTQLARGFAIEGAQRWRVRFRDARRRRQRLGVGLCRRGLARLLVGEKRRDAVEIRHVGEVAVLAHLEGCSEDAVYSHNASSSLLRWRRRGLDGGLLTTTRRQGSARQMCRDALCCRQAGRPRRPSRSKYRRAPVRGSRSRHPARS